MKSIEVYDPPMCCSTGVCGTDVDEQLVAFSADLKWLADQGVSVRRFNLSQEPGAFVSNHEVQSVLQAEGEECLPLILVDERIVSKGVYPGRAELAAVAGISGHDRAPAESIFNIRVAELVAIGAAIACNCEACLEYHFEAAQRLGISRDDMVKAANVALRVKEQPNAVMIQHAQALLTPQAAKAGGGCCGGTSSENSGGCC